MEVKIKYKKMSRSTGRNACMDLWKVLVKLPFHKDGKPACAVCGSANMVQAHHLIPREVYAFRFDPCNGIPLCNNHHDTATFESAHSAPWWFDKWMRENKPKQFAWWDANRWHRPATTADDLDYDELYYQMEQQHKELTGKWYKLDRCQSYLLSKLYDVVKEQLENKVSLPKIAEASEVGLTAVKAFIQKNVELRRLLKANQQAKAVKKAVKAKIKTPAIVEKWELPQ